MELGSVTLKRIGFFCFPIKHSTHTVDEQLLNTEYCPAADRSSESLTLSERGGKWESDQEREREKGRLNEGHGG